MYALADDALATVARVEHYDQQYKAGVRTVAQLAWPKNQPLPTAEALAVWLLEHPKHLPLAAAVAEAALLTPEDAHTDHERDAHRVAERWLRDFCKPYAPVPGDTEWWTGARWLSFAVLFLSDLVTALLAANRPRDGLAALVAAWQRFAPVPALWDTRSHPILPSTLASRDGGLRPLVVANDPRQLSLDLTSGTETPRQLWLGFEQPEPKRVPVLPLVAYEQEGGVSMTKGLGAAHAIRLYVEALLAVPPELRRVGHGPPASLYARLRNVVAGLWPRGWQCSRDWPRLLAGFAELRRLGVKWEHDGAGGVWFAVTVRTVPRDAQLDDLVRFEVLLPPGSRPGPMVSRAHLRLLGLDSAPAYRLYLSLCWLWDRHGTAGGRLIGADPPIRKGQVEGVNVGGHLVNPVALHRYPALSPDHLAQMAYATADLAAEGSSTRRTQRQQAREALDRVADQTGAVVVPAPGAAGTVQVLPAASHKAAHDGKDDLSRNLGST